MNNCLRIKDKIIHNQANKYEVGEGNHRKIKRMKALKQEELKILWEDSNWLSKKSHPKRSDEKDSVNCLTQKSVGLKKELSKYICSDIPQLHEEIAEKYSNLLGPLLLKLPPICKVSHKIPLINESKQLKHRLPKYPEVLWSELAWKIEWYTTAGYQQQQSKQHQCFVYQRKMVHYAPYSICNSRMKTHGKMWHLSQIKTQYIMI